VRPLSRKKLPRWLAAAEGPGGTGGGRGSGVGPGTGAGPGAGGRKPGREASSKKPRARRKGAPRDPSSEPHAHGPDPEPAPEELTPRQIVAELDKYVIGQRQAKRMVAIALRNRWRRWRIEDDIREEIQPANIILIGPTGVGKTEIARRLARLAQAPFIKVEASKFTEVGYVGRDVESMVRDLVDLAVSMVREEHTDDIEDEAWDRVDLRLLDLLLPASPTPAADGAKAARGRIDPAVRRARATRRKLAKSLKKGELEDRIVEVEVQTRATPSPEMLQHIPFEDVEQGLPEYLAEALGPRKKKRKVRVSEAREILFQDEVQRMLDMDHVVNEALDRAENTGIVFIDEIDKVAAPAGIGGPGAHGPDVSREGVQRDLLPIVEGTNVPTRYGMVKTDHMLFVASGAFHHAKPSDLLPELQGRFPIRVELTSLSEADFVRILTEPENALLKQYRALLKADGARLTFDTAAVREIAALATRINGTSENIGARRLQTVLATLLEDVLFEVPDPKRKAIRITREEVQRRLAPILKDPDLARYIL
jgi:ATP-dependent HslUV protease ATP-binding subunit HslU